MNNIKRMKILVIVLLLAISAVVASTANTNDGDMQMFDEISAYHCWIASGDNRILNNGEDTESQITTTADYPIGEIIWQYQITGPHYDKSCKAIASISDINDDEIDDIIVCSEDYYVRCFDGSAIGTGIVLWEHEIYSGSLWCQNELTITEDVNNDGYNDVVVGTAWGDRSIHTLSGKTGATIWTYGSTGGWVYQVDCSYDYNGDGIIDVLATAGSTADRAYCLNGLTGTLIWELPLGGGPGFSIIGIEDFTGDGQPDVLVGASNNYETIGLAYGVNGATGSIIWTFIADGSSVWALEQIDDITSDGIKDVIIGDFSGNIYGLDATSGSEIYSNSLGYAIIVRFEKINDVNGDGHPDIIPAHSTMDVTQIIDGHTGSFIWSHPVADQPWTVARVSDISGDGIDDVLIGTLFQSNYCYFLNGVDGSELCSIPYYEAVDSIAAIPDVTDDGSMEMVVGGRDGKVTCFSGGLDSSHNPIEIIADFAADIAEGTVPLLVNFTDLSIAKNTTITSWKWDFEADGIIDSEEQNPSWTYTEIGVYTVSLMVSDGTYSDTEIKEAYITVLPIGAILEIGNITGGLFRISAEVKNVGDVEATDINWNMTLDGSIIILGKNTTGTIASIPAEDEALIKSGLILGLGGVTITITANASGAMEATKTVNGFILLFYIIIISS